MKSNFLRIVPEAAKNINTQKLRTGITAGIIALGIMALVGILTSVEALKATMKESFSTIGTNTINVSTTPNIQIGTEWKRYPAITYQQAMNFKNKTRETIYTSVYTTPSYSGEISGEWGKTDPNITICGIDDNFFINMGYQVEQGRQFTTDELEAGARYIILGSDPAKKLFPGSSAPGQSVSINGERFMVIGVTKEMGSIMGMSQDVFAFIPLKIARAMYPNIRTFPIIMSPRGDAGVEETMVQATLALRAIRGLRPGQENNFFLDTSEAMMESYMTMLGQVRLIAMIIGFITILGSAIALMNIMLVSVTQRTREIGIMKALGATPEDIRLQFLTEAMAIAQLGGIIGIVAGIIIGNIVAGFMGAPFVIPWGEILLAVVVTGITAIVSGYYPAGKASRLDPIESLRYE